MNEVLFNVLLGVVIVISVILTRYLVPYFKSQIQETQYMEVLDIIERAVLSAEQVLHAPNQGKAKKAEVVAFVSHYLAERGIHITEEQLDKLIEAAVYTMNSAKEK